MSVLDELLWAVIGLLLTIAGTFTQAFVPGMPQAWRIDQVPTYSLGVTYQVGAVLLVACLGGKRAAVLSQLAYLALGLSGTQVFAQGGGVGYFFEPTFGYLLGFVPGALACGHLAFQKPPRLETLATSCFAGLLLIHLCGLVYLLLVRVPEQTWWQAAWQYSVQPLPGQFAVICAVSLIALILRRLMFY